MAMKLVLGVGDRMILTALTATAAVALCVAGAAQANTARSADFCSVSKGVANNLVNLQKQLQSAPAPTRLKAEFGAILAASGSLKSSAPGNLKKPVTNLLSLANEIAGYLKAGNWSIVSLLPHQSTLTVQFANAKPWIASLNTYYKGTCHFKV
jgi:hypothetical protein